HRARRTHEQSPGAHRAEQRLIGIVDVDYADRGVTAACVGFDGWTDAIGRIEVVVRALGAAAPYVPGAFYQRELPHLLAVLERMPVLTAVIVDAYVRLGVDQPGLGQHLHDAIGVPVIGVAKTIYVGAHATPVIRGTSTRPLYVTAIGLPIADAARDLAAMHGE